MNSIHMMTSSNGNIFRVTGPLCVEFPGEFPTERPVTRNFDVFFDLRLNKVNNGEAGDLGRNRGHYDVSVMNKLKLSSPCVKQYYPSDMVISRRTNCWCESGIALWVVPIYYAVAVSLRAFRPEISQILIINQYKLEQVNHPDVPQITLTLLSGHEKNFVECLTHNIKYREEDLKNFHNRTSYLSVKHYTAARNCTDGHCVWKKLWHPCEMRWYICPQQWSRSVRTSNLTHWPLAKMVFFHAKFRLVA